MSNEYKDWMYDKAQEFLFNEVCMIEIIEYCTSFEDGYLMICRHTDGSTGAYFVWLDDVDGWCCKFIVV